MSFKPITVSQLNTYVKQIFDSEELLHGISVVGEISGWSVSRGTAYFTLKDSSSALSCVCFVADRFLDFNNGDSVMLIGSVTYYAKSGKLNFNVSKIERYGESVLYKQFLELKAKLDEKGYFEAELKKPIPKNIKRIGVVSSETGAVIQDIINVRTRRNPSVDIVLYPVKVQGTGAEYEIAKGISVLDNYNVDVIVVARGGGSFEDLMPFNTEVVADSVFNARKVVVSAVGHETDFTICDFCSDLRAPTPSAAAELLCDDLGARKEKIKAYTKQFIVSSQKFIQYQIDILNSNIERLNKNYIYVYEDVLLAFNNKLSLYLKATRAFVDMEDIKLARKAEILSKLNPNEVLKLGYAFVKAGNNHLNSVSNVKVGDNIQITLKDGDIWAMVNEVTKIDDNQYNN